MQHDEVTLVEECPFCRSVIKPGATVCAHCGANKREPSLGGCGCVLVCVVAGLFVSVLMALDAGEVIRALGMGGVLLLLLALFRILPGRQSGWYRKNL